jgi:muramoyltetrapeptide carboxypeptidase
VSWVRPPALSPGGLIGICAPAGPVEEEALQRGVAELTSLGFRTRVLEGTRRRTRFTAGSVEERAADLVTLFRDREVGAVMCARGGAGAGWLLPRLDPRVLRDAPKPLVGYSDVTYLHLLFNQLGIVSLHGPMAAVDLSRGLYDRDSLRVALTGQGALYASAADDLVPLRKGEGEGRLRGGCLSILAAAAGTDWALAPAGEDTILFLEDVDEPPYRIDRMLLQLRESDALAGVRGIVFGDMKGCSPSVSADYGLEDVILGALAGLEVPIALGLSSGHATGAGVTLPLGVRARLVCDQEGSFEVLEPAVQA